LLPLGEHRVPVDFLAHPRAPALPCEPQYLPELRVDRARSSAASTSPVTCLVPSLGHR
jgi:hypothetical protein